MKVKWIIFIFGLTVIVMLYMYFLMISNQLTVSEIQNRIVLSVNDFCDSLDIQASKAILKTHCPTCLKNVGLIKECKFANNGSEMAGLNEEGCLVKKSENGYTIQVRKTLIYGFSDRRSGIDLQFVLDSEGNIISQSIPSPKCEL